MHIYIQVIIYQYYVSIKKTKQSMQCTLTWWIYSHFVTGNHTACRMILKDTNIFIILSIKLNSSYIYSQGGDILARVNYLFVCLAPLNTIKCSIPLPYQLSSSVKWRMRTQELQDSFIASGIFSNQSYISMTLIKRETVQVTLLPTYIWIGSVEVIGCIN